jgi:CRISPR/Cas system CSM-associated protein Csm5 (group 7 of RAMP superfamily)
MVTFNFTTITPLHISNGEELGKNIDYIISNGQFLRLDQAKLSSFLAERKVFDFRKKYDFKAIESIVKRYSTEICDIECRYIVKADNKVIEYLKKPGAEGKHFVKEFINCNGRFYIPASSVKGALLTVLGKNYLGIDANNGSLKEQKVVFHDSDFISSENFIVLRTEPGRPAINVMCLKERKTFELKMIKKGELDINKLKDNLLLYSIQQIKKVKREIEIYKSQITNRPNGANIFLNALENIYEEKIGNKEYLINLGFGGGSWFKLFNNALPFRFKNRRSRQNELAHTTFTTSSKIGYSQLGWCKLKIEES